MKNRNDIIYAWKYIADFKRRIRKYIEKKQYAKALALVSVCADLLYQINQIQRDDELEAALFDIQKALRLDTEFSKKAEKNTVLFYDSFGLELRGLAKIYLRALAEKGYKIIYVTRECAEGRIGLLLEELRRTEYRDYYIGGKNRAEQINALNEIFRAETPASAFLYAMPDDVPAVLVFRAYEGRVRRYQINLTDHAYWLGRYSFDYCLEFRGFGAGVSVHKRGIPPDRLLNLPYYPVLNSGTEFQGFPFKKAEGQKVVFSGGSLYKTLGGENRFYHMAEKILNRERNVIFWYAGSGDTTEIDKLCKKFPARCYHTEERPDLLALMERCDLYLGTYPMAGALMEQYAAMAGLPLVQLYYDADNEGILMNEDRLDFMFRNEESLLNRAHELLAGGKQAEYIALLKSSVITPETFADQLDKILSVQRSDFPCTADDVDTGSMTQTYVDRFKFEDIENCVVRKENFRLVPAYPGLFADKAFRLAGKKIRRALSAARN